MFIYEFRQATKGLSKYDFYDLFRPDVKPEYFSSLRKCRAEVKKRVEEQPLSRENWTEENLISNGCYVVINSGGTGIFSYKRIRVK